MLVASHLQQLEVLALRDHGLAEVDGLLPLPLGGTGYDGLGGVSVDLDALQERVRRQQILVPVPRHGQS